MNSIVVRAKALSPALASDIEHCRVVNFDDPRALLLPDDRAAAVVSFLEASLAPSGDRKAAELTAILLGSYPRHSVDDANIYTRAMVSLIAEYPAFAASEAIDKITRTNKYIPTRAEMAAALEAAIAPVRKAAAGAKAMGDMARRRTDERERLAAIARDREAFRAKHGDKSVLDVLREKTKSSTDETRENT